MARKILFAVLVLMVGAAPGGAAGDGAGPVSWQNDLTPIGAGDAGDWDHSQKTLEPNDDVRYTNIVR